MNLVATVRHITESMRRSLGRCSLDKPGARASGGSGFRSLPDRYRDRYRYHLLRPGCWRVQLLRTNGDHSRGYNGADALDAPPNSSRLLQPRRDLTDGMRCAVGHGDLGTPTPTTRTATSRGARGGDRIRRRRTRRPRWRVPTPRRGRDCTCGRWVRRESWRVLALSSQ